MKKSGKLLTLTKLGMGLVLIMCVSLATFFMASCKMTTVVVNGKFIDENGCLVLTYDNGEEEVVGHVKGVRGLHGCANAGGQGVVEIKTDDLNQLIVVYSDGLTDEFGRVEESADMPDNYADRVRIDSITHEGDAITIHYVRGESVVVDVDCDDGCKFESEAEGIRDMVKTEIRPHKADECGIYECKCDACGKRSVLHGIFHKDLIVEYKAAEGKNLCEDGGMMYRKCAACGAPAGDPVPVAPRPHEWEKWGVRTAPTHKAAGMLERYCPNCGKFETTEIPKLPWFIPRTDEEIAATPYSCHVTKPKTCCCDPDGEADYVYSIDGQEITFHANIPATLHKLGGKDLAEIALRSANGEVEYSKVDFRWPRIHLDLANGLIKEDENNIATCAKPGTGSFVCEECGRTITVETVVPHKAPLDGTVVTVTEPTCTKKGEGKGPCPVCGEMQSVAIPALGHEYVIQELIHDSGLKGHLVEKCSRCGDIRDDRVVDVIWIGKEATCAGEGEGGYDQYQYEAKDGSIYKTEKTPVKKLEHLIKDSKGNKVDVSKLLYKLENGELATVEDVESGKRIYVIDLEKANGLIVEFADHKADCKDGSYGRGYIQCSRCGEYLLYATYKAHPGYRNKKSSAWEIKPETCTEAGYQKYVCPDCGYTEIINGPAPKGHQPCYCTTYDCGVLRYGLIKEADGTFTAKSYCIVCSKPDEHYYFDLPDKRNLVLGVHITKAEKITRMPNCQIEGEKEITYTYKDPEHPGAYATLMEKESIPTTGEHLILLRNGDKVPIEDVAMREMIENEDGTFKEVIMKDDQGLYVVDINDKRLPTDDKFRIHEFAEQHADCGKCAIGIYGKGYFECPVCGGQVLVATYKGHHWRSIISETLPTCEEDGYRRAVCDECDNTYDIKLHKLGHDYKVEILEEPDFKHGGKLKITCNRCGKVKTIELPSLMSDDYKVTAITSVSSNWTITVKDITGDENDNVTVSFRQENPPENYPW